MKKRIILGLSAYSVLFLFMGLYIVYTIQIGTAKLNDIIRLHQVEILREQFLIQIKRVQSDLALKHTHYSRRFEIVLRDVRLNKPAQDPSKQCSPSPRNYQPSEIFGMMEQLARLEENYFFCGSMAHGQGRLEV